MKYYSIYDPDAYDLDKSRLSESQAEVKGSNPFVVFVPTFVICLIMRKMELF